MESSASQFERLVQETHQSEAEVMTQAFQSGLQQLWREEVFCRYLRKKITREEAIEAVGIDWVELADRQHQAIQEDLDWALRS